MLPTTSAQEAHLTRYWLANFTRIKAGNLEDRGNLDYGLNNNVWVMQYQYGPQDPGPVANNWGMARQVSPGDVLVAWLANPPQFFAIGTVRRPRSQADHTDTVERTLKQRSHLYHDGIVNYESDTAFYEDFSTPLEPHQPWAQRIDVEEWTLVAPKGIEPPEGYGNARLTSPRVALVEINPHYFPLIERKLRMQANPLEQLLHDAEKVLEVIPQIIFQGPPGTGKTYAAKRLAARILRIPQDSVDQEEDTNLGPFHEARFGNRQTDNTWEIVQFHPSYGYEDFVRGIEAYVPDTLAGGPSGIGYRTVSRILDRLVRHHRDGTDRGKRPKTVLIIDEINRANLGQVLGELIYALEYRGSEVETPYRIKEADPTKESATLSVPPGNFFIVGTMNTADRSIGRIDYAVQRRFAFLQLHPDGRTIKEQNGTRSNDEGDDEDKNKERETEKDWAKSLFDCVAELFRQPDGKPSSYLAPEFLPDDVQVGHTYFLGTRDEVCIKFAYQVYPLLREYVRDGVFMHEAGTGPISLNLPGGIQINLAQRIDATDILEQLDASWLATPSPSRDGG